jgi:hypothetical protein
MAKFVIVREARSNRKGHEMHPSKSRIAKLLFHFTFSICLLGCGKGGNESQVVAVDPSPQASPLTSVEFCKQLKEDLDEYHWSVRSGHTLPIYFKVVQRRSGVDHKQKICSTISKSIESAKSFFEKYTDPNLPPFDCKGMNNWTHDDYSNSKILEELTQKEILGLEKKYETEGCA